MCAAAAGAGPDAARINASSDPCILWGGRARVQHLKTRGGPGGLTAGVWVGGCRLAVPR